LAVASGSSSCFKAFLQATFSLIVEDEAAEDQTLSLSQRAEIGSTQA
jgi:hypothetical protein